MIDETTVYFPIHMTTDDYFILVQLARRKGMTRTQLIMEALKQYILAEQEKWRQEEEERRIAGKIKPMTPQPQPEGEGEKSAGGRRGRDGGEK